ncbi:MAG: RNA-binding S4 domain-containing protein [Sphingomonadaceae bacterium]|nr:RNA-binding S4 domain-containing protein [Sphingomonadaceae bacterium]
MRIDRLLYHLRLARSRSVAHAMVDCGHIRRNGVRILRASQGVTVGDILTMPLGKGVLVLELLALPVRRGPSGEAQSCYRVLDASGQSAIAAPKDTSEGHALP